MSAHRDWVRGVGRTVQHATARTLIVTATTLDRPLRAHPWWPLPLDVHAAHHYLGIPLCPVYARLAVLGCPPDEQRVGYLVGGAGGRQGRYHWLRVGWPDEWRRLTAAVPWLKDYR